MNKRAKLFFGAFLSSKDGMLAPFDLPKVGLAETYYYVDL
jgi:hypothetical protein